MLQRSCVFLAADGPAAPVVLQRVAAADDRRIGVVRRTVFAPTDRPMKLVRTVVTSCCCWLAGGAAVAQIAEAGDATGAEFHEPLLRIEAAPSAWAGTVDAGANANANAPELADYRLWIGAGRASMGLGWAGVAVGPVDPVGTPPGLNRLPSAMVVGFRYQVSDRSRVYVDAASLADELQDRRVGMGFEFKPVRSTALSMARGTLFRVQWSARSQVSLRLRGGGMRVVLRSEF